MKSSIKIIKRKQGAKHKPDEDSNEMKTSEGEKSAKGSTREMVSTVQSWIAELQQRKRAKAHSFPAVPVIAPAASRTT
jgi:hypothetical protein